MKIAGIILAGGKGTRINSNKVNKVTLPFLGKPLVSYGVELFQGIASPIVIVIGAFPDSVKDVLKNYTVTYTFQEKRLGTAHAAKVGMEKLKSSPPEIVLVGYGDHMMFYRKNTVNELVKKHLLHKAAISIITTIHSNPDKLAWGRVVRDSKHYIVDSVEQKDATPEQRKITELNAGFYCFDYKFMKENIDKVKKSAVSGEFYINALIHIAIEQGKKVFGYKVPFKEVGIGINRMPELQSSQEIFIKSR